MVAELDFYAVGGGEHTKRRKTLQAESASTCISQFKRAYKNVPANRSLVSVRTDRAQETRPELTRLCSVI